MVDFIYVGFSTEVEVSHNTKVQSIWYMAYTPFPLLLHLEHILLTGLLLRETLIFQCCFNNMRQGVSHRPSHFHPQVLLVCLDNLKYSWRKSWTVQFYHREVVFLDHHLDEIFCGKDSKWIIMIFYLVCDKSVVLILQFRLLMF